MSTKYFLEAYGVTDVGLKRETNEDSYSAQTDIGFFIIADGLGGHDGGEVASEMTVDSMVEAMHALTAIRSLKTVISESIPLELLTISANFTNDLIMSTAANYPQYSDMSSTLVSLLFFNRKVVVTNVGDSRAYCLRDNKLTQLSVDHVVITEDSYTGKFTRFLTKAIGAKKEVYLDSSVHDVFPNDIFLICSDGLTDMVDDETIFSIINGSTVDMNLKVKALVGKAKANGGVDNITILLVKIT